MLIDTHCHINLMVKKEFDAPLSVDEIEAAEQIIAAAKSADVTRIINVGTSLIESKNSISLAQLYPNIFASVGIHPNDLNAQWHNEFAEVKKLINAKNKVVALGETGLDFFRSPDHAQRQIDAFKAHIECALENNLGLVIHSRNAAEETLRVLEEYAKEKLRAVMHCFSYDHFFANSFINLGFYLGIGATITYPKNDILRDIVTTVPLTSLVLETDAPYLPPQQIRGQRNSPVHIRTVAQYIAELRSINLKDVAHATTENATKLFNLPL